MYIYICTYIYSYTYIYNYICIYNYIYIYIRRRQRDNYVMKKLTKKLELLKKIKLSWWKKVTICFLT